MIDLVLGAVIVVSTVFGLLRGFVSIVVGTLAWLLAVWAAFVFGNDVALKLAQGSAPDMLHYVGGYALTFVGVMLLVMLIGWVIRASVSNTVLSSVDRLAGGGLGLVRGVFFACVLVVLMSFTPLARQADWQQSRVLPVLAPAVAWMQAQLPEFSIPAMPAVPKLRDIDLNKLSLSGDNGRLDDRLQQAAAQLPQLGQAVSEVLSTTRSQPSNKGLPRPLDESATPQPDQAGVAASQSDSARVVETPSGQERSP